jgi:catechol 2,3-dioxygenase-like lactoylglutathione lyase family enzyme
MNIRVANIAECYKRWKGLGAEFLTEPKIHEAETRCYMRDPDGHLIEVGEAKK